MKKGVSGILSALGGAVAGSAVVANRLNKQVTGARKMSDKHLALFLMMNQWVKVKQAGKDLAAYLDREGYHNIAIYGMSYAGETLVDELKGSSITVRYGIDRNAEGIYADIDVVSPDKDLDEVEAVIVTSITFFNEIEGLLSKKLDCPIISLEDILYEI